MHHVQTPRGIFTTPRAEIAAMIADCFPMQSLPTRNRCITQPLHRVNVARRNR